MDKNVSWKEVKTSCILSQSFFNYLLFDIEDNSYVSTSYFNTITLLEENNSIHKSDCSVVLNILIEALAKVNSWCPKDFLYRIKHDCLPSVQMSIQTKTAFDKVAFLLQSGLSSLEAVLEIASFYLNESNYDLEWDSYPNINNID